jgi:hypothetical protein
VRNETRRPCPTESVFLLLLMFNIPFLSARGSYNCRISGNKSNPSASVGGGGGGKGLSELVVNGADGKPMTVRYSMLSAMLLNELQKRALKIALEEREIGALKERVTVLEQARTTRPEGGAVLNATRPYRTPRQLARTR